MIDHRHPFLPHLPGFFTKFAFLLVVAGSISCNQPFEPKGPYEEKLAAFCILSPDSPVQYVRLHTTYDPPGFDPLDITDDKGVGDVMVSISESGMTHVLRDTVLPRLDTTRYTTSIKAYATDSISSFHGKVFDLVVSSPTYGVLTASTGIPFSSSLSYEGHSELNAPGSNPDIAIRFSATTTSLGVGHLMRMFVEYETFAEGVWTKRSIEVPSGFKAYVESEQTYEQGEFPKMRRNVSPRISQRFLTKAYLIAVAKALKGGYEKIIFKRVIFTFLQAEKNLYTYYNVVNGFQDPGSIRLDYGSYFNIEGGYGIFGGYAIDSVAHTLPSNFSYNIQ